MQLGLQDEIIASLKTNCITIFDIQSLAKNGTLPISECKKSLLQFSFNSDLQSLRKIYHVMIKKQNILKFVLYQEGELVDLLKADKASVKDAYLYAIYDSEYLSVEDVLDQVNFTKQTYSEPIVEFTHNQDVFHQNSLTRRQGMASAAAAAAPVQKIVPRTLQPKKTSIDLSKKQFPKEKPKGGMINFQKQDQSAKDNEISGKLGFAKAQSKQENKWQRKSRELSVDKDVEMEPVEEKVTRISKPVVDTPVVASLSEDMDEMEIAPISRRNRKRALVVEESQDSVGAMELEVSEPAEKPAGAMDKFVTKSQEHSETFKMNCSDPKNSEQRKRNMKRVKKEKAYTNKDGYFVIEEYSSYEEIDPKEMEQQKQIKMTASKAKAAAKIPNKNQVQSTLQMKTKTAGPTAPAKKQGGIAGFFKKKAQV